MPTEPYRGRQKAATFRNEWIDKELNNLHLKCRDVPISVHHKRWSVCPFDEGDITWGQQTRTFYPGQQAHTFYHDTNKDCTVKVLFSHACEACAKMAHGAFQTVLHSLPQEDMDALCNIYPHSEILKAAQQNIVDQKTLTSIFRWTTQDMDRERVSSIQRHLTKTLVGILYPSWNSGNSFYKDKVNSVVSSITGMSACEGMSSSMQTESQSTSVQPRDNQSKVDVSNWDSESTTDLSHPMEIKSNVKVTSPDTASIVDLSNPDSCFASEVRQCDHWNSGNPVYKNKVDSIISSNTGISAFEGMHSAKQIESQSTPVQPRVDQSEVEVSNWDGESTTDPSHPTEIKRKVKDTSPDTASRMDLSNPDCW